MLILCVLFAFGMPSSFADLLIPPHAPSPHAEEATPSPSATPVVQVPLTQSEKKTLWAQFEKKLDEEEKAVHRQEKSEGKQLGTGQSAKRKSWREHEKKMRAQYFDQHTAGPERRAYLQDYISRKKAMDQAQDDEWVVARKLWGERLDLMKRGRKAREAKFKASLDHNQRPEEATSVHTP